MNQTITTEIDTFIRNLGFFPSGDHYYHAGADILLYGRDTVDEAKSITPNHLDMVVVVPDDATDVYPAQCLDLCHEIVRLSDLPAFLLHRVFGNECLEVRLAKQHLHELTDIYNDAEEDAADAAAFSKEALVAVGNQVIFVRNMLKPRFHPVAVNNL